MYMIIYITFYYALVFIYQDKLRDLRYAEVNNIKQEIGDLEKQIDNTKDRVSILLTQSMNLYSLYSQTCVDSHL